ncbi:MAG: nitrous oxide reductase family maturation protein NosD, partial [Candidatus Hodarchaeota archaeon]
MALTRGRGSQKLIQTGRMFLLTVSLGLLVLVIMAAPIISPLTHPTTRYGGQIADGSYLIPSKTLSSIDGEEDVWLSKVSQSQAIAPIEIDSDYTLDSDLTFKSHGFLVIADDITLDLNGYTITGSEKGTGIDMNGRMGVTVKGGTIELFEYGIHLFDSSGNTLSGNTVTANENGFTLENSNGNTITGNTATANGDGFSLWGSSGNTITGNTATANDRAGFKLSISSNNNIFSGNTATTNEDGFNLRRNSDNNTFSGNTVTTNENGFALLSSSGNTFSGNTATANGNGFTLGSNCENNTLTGNNVTDNEYGIYL